MKEDIEKMSMEVKEQVRENDGTSKVKEEILEEKRARKEERRVEGGELEVRKENRGFGMEKREKGKREKDE